MCELPLRTLPAFEANNLLAHAYLSQDLGNTNYSIMVPKDIFDRRPNAELITRALRSLGVPAEVNHRSDITLEGSKMSISRRIGVRRCSVGVFDLTSVLLHLRLGLPAQQPASVSPRDHAYRRTTRPARRCAPFRKSASLASSLSPPLLALIVRVPL